MAKRKSKRAQEQDLAIRSVDLDRLLTVQEAGRLLRRSPSTIRRWIRSRGLPAYELAGKQKSYLIDPWALKLWLEGRGRETPENLPTWERMIRAAAAEAVRKEKREMEEKVLAREQELESKKQQVEEVLRHVEGIRDRLKRKEVQNEQ